MTMVAITINGQEVSAPAGITILKAAQGAGIDIPTLCHHPALGPVGACRICLVEVKGQRNLQTACTFPIMAGMEIQTESERVVKARKLVLDLLFSERNHYCMYCEMSGDCELQNLGYRYGIDHWVYPTYVERFPVDATRKFFLMEHNRCVLCGRCMRACSELVANHTLGLRQRGAGTMVSADGNDPFGQSSCIACGTCLQVCPTGALFDRRSSFMGRSELTQGVKSTCSQCSLGCGMKIVTRGGNVLRIEGDWDAEVTQGLLCQKGRFDPLYEERPRITQPLVRKSGRLVPTDWPEALQAAAGKITGAAGNIGVLTTSNATNEALYLLATLFRGELKTTNTGLLGGAVPALIERSKRTLADLDGCDVILVVGADPVNEQPVASFMVKRAADRGARLIVVGDGEDGLAAFAFKHLPFSEIDQAVEIAGRADRPVVLCGPGITPAAAASLKPLQKAAFIALEPGVNTRAAVALGLANGFDPAGTKALLVLQGEEAWDGTDILAKADRDVSVIAVAGFVSPVTEKADVVLPGAIWSERSGSFTNTEGRILTANGAVPPQGSAKQDWEIIALLAEALGRKIGGAIEDIAARAAREIR